MSSVVIDPHAWLPDRVDRDVVYSRNSSHALMMLRARRASSTFIDTLWLSWDLGPGYDPDGENAGRIVSTIAEAARSGRPFPIGKIILLTHNSERTHQVFTALHPWYDVDSGPPDMYALYPRRRRTRPSVGLSPIERLERAGVQIETGLSDQEIKAIQKRFAIAFSVPHRALLQAGLPVDLLESTGWHRSGWPNWRIGDPQELATWIERAPMAEDKAPPSIPPGGFPPLIPLRGNGYLPSGSHLEHPWVLSAHEVDVIYYGRDIGTWIGMAFEGGSRSPDRPAPDARIPYWSDLVDRNV